MLGKVKSNLKALIMSAPVFALGFILVIYIFQHLMLLEWIIDSWMKPSETEEGITANAIDYLFEIILEIFLGVFFSIKGVLGIVILLPWKKDMIESIFFDHLR